MNSGTIFLLLLLLAGPLMMFVMHRGGHGHGGMGGCGGHGHNRSDEPTPDAHRGDEKKPLLGPPGTEANAPAPVAAEGHKHRHGC